MRRLMMLLAAVLVFGSVHEARGQGQMPEGMKTYWNLKHGFQLRIPERWTIETLPEDNYYLIDIWEPKGRVLASVGRVVNVSAELGEAYARRYIAEEVDRLAQLAKSDGWAEIKLLWASKADFSFPLGFYGEWEARAKNGREFYLMIYYLRDDGTGRNLPPGQVSRTTMVFLTLKRDSAEFRDLFHYMAGSFRFLTPKP